MPLSNKAKIYIRKNLEKKSVKELASELKLQEDEVREFIEEHKKQKQSATGSLTPERKRLFTVIALLIPFVFFGLLETGLRISNYRGNTNLFLKPLSLEGNYKLPNPNFAARYFFYTTVIPSPPQDFFLTEKPANGFRVFVMGESSAAGYPYGYNGLFGRVTKDILQDVMPDYHVEVVTVATSAINTYTLFDQVEEVLAEKPDAIFIYTGHNEFYGALGAGSNESLGSFPGFTRFYLRIQRLKTFMFLRDQVVTFSKWMQRRMSPPTERGVETLMQQVVRDQEITLDSPVYDLGKRQFESNMEVILNRFQEAGVPVFLGSLASNLKDHHPFESVPTSNLPAASQVFEEARTLYAQGEPNTALEKFSYARDLDALKFRATSEFNAMIRSMAERPGVYYVPVKERLIEHSPNGIIGNELMLEHLHPNSKGYFLIGTAFFDAVQNASFLGRNADLSLLQPVESYYDRMELTELDHRIVDHRLKVLMGNWPFVKDGTGFSYRGYRFEGIVDSLAFEVVNNKLRWDQAKVTLGEHYLARREYDKTLAEFRGLMRDQFYNDSPFLITAQIYLDRGRLPEAEPFLRKAHEMEPSAFTYKMLGAIEVDRRNFDEGIRLLEQSLELKPNDAQAVYNLSGAYAQNGDLRKGLELANQLLSLNPEFPGGRAWKAQLEQFLSAQNR